MKQIHIRTALKNVRRSPFQAMAAVFVLTVTFFVVTILAVMVYSTDNIIRYFETRPQMIAFLKDDVEQTEVTKLRTDLENDDRVKEVRLVTKEQAFQIYKDATADNPLLSELVSPSIFPASLEFTLADLGYAEDLIGEIKNETVVDQIGFTATLGGESALGETVSRLQTITRYLRLGGIVFVSILMLTSLMVLLVVVGMRLVTRKQEIEILDLIGATPAFIRSPIVLESIMYSVVGVFLGWAFGFILTLYTSPAVVTYFSQIKVLPRSVKELVIIFLLILGGELLLGMILSIGGSMLAVRRAKKGL